MILHECIEGEFDIKIIGDEYTQALYWRKDKGWNFGFCGVDENPPAMMVRFRARQTNKMERGIMFEKLKKNRSEKVARQILYRYWG